MATTSPYSGREHHHAERLSVCSGLPRATIEQTTGIHLNTLSRWAKRRTGPNAVTRHAFGAQRTLPGAVGQFRTTNGCLVLARGKAQPVRGFRDGENRPDEIYLDDYEAPKRAKNPTLVEADNTRIKSAYYPALKEGDSLIKLTAALRGKAHTLPPQGPFGTNIHDFGPGRGF